MSTFSINFGGPSTGNSNISRFGGINHAQRLRGSRPGLLEDNSYFVLSRVTKGAKGISIRFKVMFHCYHPRRSDVNRPRSIQYPSRSRWSPCDAALEATSDTYVVLRGKSDIIAGSLNTTDKPSTMTQTKITLRCCDHLNMPRLLWACST
jgi:hypothetical protein